jgi:hypothetical protein
MEIMPGLLIRPGQIAVPDQTTVWTNASVLAFSSNAGIQDATLDRA